MEGTTDIIELRGRITYILPLGQYAHVSISAQEQKVMLNKLCFGEFYFRFTQRPYQQFLAQLLKIDDTGDTDQTFVCNPSLTQCY